MSGSEDVAIQSRLSWDFTVAKTTKFHCFKTLFFSLLIFIFIKIKSPMIKSGDSFFRSQLSCLSKISSMFLFNRLFFVNWQSCGNLEIVFPQTQDKTAQLGILCPNYFFF